MRPVYPPPALTQLCQNCRAPVEDGYEYCEAPLCQTKSRVRAAQVAAEKVRQSDEREAKLARRRTAKLLRKAAQRSGAKNLGKIAYAIVPHVRAETAPRSDQQSKTFLEHLDAIIAEAFASPPKATREFSHEEPPDEDFANWYAIVEDDPLALTAACIACQGDCCFQGNASNAFLTPNTISWLRHQIPELTPEDVRSAYVDRMPVANVSGSCIFHGPEGCTLPRNMRANVCNRWQCSYRHQLAKQIAKKGAERSVVAGLPRDHYQHPGRGEASVKVVSVDEQSGVRVHDDMVLPALRIREDS